MNSNPHNSITNAGRDGNPGSAEATLRLVASLPAPKGLEDRVIEGLKKTPRTARVLHWPSVLHPTSSWMRGAAAAAIVFVVAGGGWGIYTRVQPGQPAKVIVMPRAGAGGGFSSAGAMRTPQTVKGTIVAGPVSPIVANPSVSEIQTVQEKPLKKESARVVPMKQSRVRSRVANKTSDQPAVSVAK